MLTRRTFLTTIAAAPLARFCKTEPVRLWQPGLLRNRSREEIAARFAKRWEAAIRERFGDEGVADAPFFTYRWEPKETVERRYNLPQGTLG